MYLKTVNFFATHLKSLRHKMKGKEQLSCDRNRLSEYQAIIPIF